MAMAVAFWGFLTMIGDFGLFASIVQSNEVSKDQLREIFGFIIILNILFLTITLIGSPIISGYFKEPRLTAILRTLSIVFFFIPFYVIPHSLLLRDMNFKYISVIDVLCNLFGATTSFLFAVTGHGVWSLVYGTLTQYFCRGVTFSLVAKSHYRPQFRIDKIRCMLSFSSFFTGSTILRYLFFKSDIIIGGKYMGPDALGIYSIANQLAFAPVEKMSNIIPQIAFPAFSKMQLDIKSYSSYFLKGMKLLNVIFIPCYIALFFLAEDIVALLLGPNWEQIVLPMRILCLVMPLRTLEVLFIPAMNGLGKSRITMITSGMSLFIMMCAFWVGSNWGYIGMCWSWVSGFTIIFLIMIAICIKELHLNIVSIAHTYITPVISSVGLLIVGLIMSKYYKNIMHPFFNIISFSMASVFLYFAAVYIIDRPIIIYLKSLIPARK